MLYECQLTGHITLKREPLLLDDYIEIYGYPQDSASFIGTTGQPHQICGYGTVVRETSYKVYYDADTEHGMSGSPVMKLYGSQLACVAVHTEGFDEYPDLNSGVKINDSIITFIRDSL